MSLVSGVVGSVAGGALGALAWAGVSYASDYEIGWIAWGIGALAGYGMSLGSKGEGDKAAGVVAAVIALASVFGGKYAAVHFAVQKAFAEGSAEPIDDRWLQVRLADDVVAEREEVGQALEWPPGKTLEEAEGPADYPVGIWDEAKTRFEAMPRDERESMRAEMIRERSTNLELVRSDFTAQGFQDSLGPHDLLWSALAVATAFKLASRAKTKPEEAPAA